MFSSPGLADIAWFGYLNLWYCIIHVHLGKRRWKDQCRIIFTWNKALKFVRWGCNSWLIPCSSLLPVCVHFTCSILRLCKNALTCCTENANYHVRIRKVAKVVSLNQCFWYIKTVNLSCCFKLIKNWSKMKNNLYVCIDNLRTFKWDKQYE